MLNPLLALGIGNLVTAGLTLAYIPAPASVAVAAMCTATGVLDVAVAWMLRK